MSIYSSNFSVWDLRNRWKIIAQGWYIRVSRFMTLSAIMPAFLATFLRKFYSNLGEEKKKQTWKTHIFICTCVFHNIFYYPSIHEKWFCKTHSLFLTICTNNLKLILLYFWNTWCRYLRFKNRFLLYCYSVSKIGYGWFLALVQTRFSFLIA